MVRILSLLFILSVSTQLTRAETKKLNYKIDLGVQALSVDSDKVRAKLWSVKPKLRSSYELNESSTFYFDFGASLETGSNRSFQVDEYNPRRDFYVSKAFFQFRFMENLGLEVGAINQEIYHSPIFLDYLAFVGLRETWRFKLLGLDINIFAQQSIPNNQDLSQRISLIEAGTPLFYAETIELAYKNSNFRSALAYTHFNFKNVSKTVADKSRYLGNTVEGIASDNATFVYPYQGHNSTLMLSYRLPSFLLEFQGQYLHNSKAPNSKASAYFTGLYVGLPTLFLHLEHYKIRNDATIAYFNSGLYGHTNRLGYAIGFSYEKPGQFKTTLLYHNQDLVNEATVYQAKRNLVTMLVTKDF